ncbi:unnamed protein product [Vitrella brassicaformis CCMP3155]|uniref:Uncharacterized protein n=2 Tax=Vitrella brassicaformis TaxID=1169539 RepID=A0A0G4EAW9_VITBC|nr:unnamed protein product [Vitrella brassicaformis CCMP3155]|eukprot:CEL92434.1 unnamed protein product [Vitrella brassicaformis CCMP3155]
MALGKIFRRSDSLKEPPADRSSAAPKERTAVQQLQVVRRALWNVAWWSWWPQLALTVVSASILIFANTISEYLTLTQAILNGTALAGVAVFFSILSLIWTYGYTRLSLDLRRTAPSKAVVSIKHWLRSGVWINLIGLLLSMVSAEQIVGVLFSKILRMSQLVFGGGPGGVVRFSAPTGGLTLQPLDILVVQANTNTSVAHLVGLLTSLWLATRNERLQQKVALEQAMGTADRPAEPEEEFEPDGPRSPLPEFPDDESLEDVGDDKGGKK